ncbi:MAG: metal ABC transporter substrate-binding protein [Acidimicrobiia bacterium]|nr:metal ABC transporter substrate-binding protein [Acidimicrobiia bacterium]
MRVGPASRLLASIAVIVVAACGTSSDGPDSSLRVVATTTILGDVASQIVGDQGIVEVLMPVGADPHEYQPSAQQGAALRAADVVIANGLGLEEALGDILTAAEADGVTVIRIAEFVDPIPFSGTHEEGEEHQGSEENHADGDPHLWMDPIRMAAAARAVGERLTSISPDVDWPQRANEYAQQLETADAEIAAILGAVAPERRYLVTNHEAFGYLAARYDFDVIGSVIPGGSTLASPSSAELAALVDTIEEYDAPAIFVENISGTDLAESVAAEIGRPIEVVELFSDSLGEPGSGADTLISLLITNASRIADALSS